LANTLIKPTKAERKLLRMLDDAYSLSKDAFGITNESTIERDGMRVRTEVSARDLETLALYLQHAKPVTIQ
jgi:hypothetical protein